MLIRYLLPAAITLLSCMPVVADEEQAALLERYRVLIKDYQLTDKVTLQSTTDNHRLTADVYSHVDFRFNEVKKLLRQPEIWCEFLTLNLNIKTCLVEKNSNKTNIVVFAGRKYYEQPEDTEFITYRFQRLSDSKTFLGVELSSESGPMGTSYYIIRLQATPAKGGTVLHVHSGYTTSVLSRWGTNVYLATLGRHKVGFSISGHDELAQPVYVGGMKGIIERNAMRYYLSLAALFETWSLAESKRLKSRINRWFDMTQVYKRQLYEMNREEYLEIKHKEYNNQRHFQRLLDKGEKIESLLNNNDNNDD